LCQRLTTVNCEVPAKDVAGNVSPASDSATVTTPGGGTTRTTLNALADARVEQANPMTNYGTASTLGADQTSTAHVESYLKFDASVATGAVTSANRSCGPRRAPRARRRMAPPLWGEHGLG
jgi:hypothetical protein